MQNNFLQISTKSGRVHYVNINHIVDIYEDKTSTVVELINSSINCDSLAIELIERIYKIQWNDETKNTNNDTK